MAYKRSRATFEADLQAHQSPYVIYGTPLPPLDPDTRDDGSYVPVWKQEVTDEQGRKRLHGAFTGGFSAGYFNTVGSKEGWTPSNFVSSKSKRNKDAVPKQQRPEDFMDEEDIADAEEARKVQTAGSFSAIGSTADELSQKAMVMDLFKTSGETMGVKLLKKMGWRDGQGIGPKVRRKARLGEDAGLSSGDVQETHLFAPENSEMIAFGRKNDRKGLGFEGEGRLGETSTLEQQSTSRLGLINRDEEETGIGILPASSQMKKKKTATRGAFGVGILNDNGSDDDDPYSMGPQISYNRVIGGGKKKKPLLSSRTAANPLLNSKPIFISKKAAATKTASTFRRCHDGRLPLDGFVLSRDPDPLSSILTSDKKYPPPVIPPEWKSAKSTSNPPSVAATYLSTAEVAKASNLSPKSRAALLGESQLPGKSVFDFLSATARSRIATATKNPNLPPALNEASSITTSAPSTRSPSSLIPPLDSQTALTALGRGTAGWMPYAEDLSKRTRYRSFLEIHAGLRGPESSLPDRAPGHSSDEWANEMREFAHAAQIFKPMTGMMASRFTSASSAPKLASDGPDAKSAPGEHGGGVENLVSRPAEVKKDPAEEAARLGMYGPLTRSTQAWHPTRLLCKRFNVRPPAHVMVDPGDAAPSAEGVAGASLPQKNLELVGKRDMEEMMREGNVGRMGMRDAGAGTGEGETGIDEGGAGGALPRRKEVVVDPERNDALEKERPSDAMFKAVFGSDSEDD
ncbi:MAG: hypothetical protein HETSPECPRED_010094 [Heterodermia speciosa]|uniref:G-patch domain-containing protein n=1 Tax=Heterodermia speciosa TaxID=116794 RepID=A0A8H3ER00_9LECA|nr:MAG: hypothetical protein HETSPECPRED_010094 [Heterodermia speciosa]